MAHIVDRLETRVQHHVLRSLPAAGRDHLKDAPLRTLLVEYGTWRDRFVSPTARTVRMSRELTASPLATTYAVQLAVLREKLERGVDITPHLSERVTNPFANVAAPSYEHRTDRDALLSDWGIHHLHLTDRPNARTVRRGDDVLLAAFTDEAAYLIDIVPHPTRTEGWAKQDIFNIIVRNGPTLASSTSSRASSASTLTTPTRTAASSKTLGSRRSLGEYLELERPTETATEACFVVLKGPRRGLPLSPAGLDEVLDGARARAGLSRCTCHQLRHTCLTRLREQGMALEAVQAQAGHASIESTRIYLHLANDWLAREYLAAAEAIDAQLDPLAREIAS